jgi:transcriptional regulator with XRE-family HTH domain
MKRSAILLPLPAEELLRVLGERVILARRARKVTQSDLAAQVGVGLSTLRLIESGAPTVQIGFYVMTLWALDLLDELRESVERLGRESSIGVLLENEASISGTTRRRRE